MDLIAWRFGAARRHGAEAHVVRLAEGLLLQGVCELEGAF